MKLTATVFLSGACLLASCASAQTTFSEVLMEAPGPQGPLKGSLLMPHSKQRAAVLILPGSGPTDRDGNNPLGVRSSSYGLLAEGLSARGIATLRIDKRGMFASAAAVKDGNAVTIADYSDDVQSWVNALRSATRESCVWVLGHSEGGLVALASAKDLREACGYMLLSTAGRPMGQVLREQLKANPANAPLVDQAFTAIDALEQGRRVDASKMHPALQPLFYPAVQGFLISAFSYGPSRLIAGMTKPVLVLQGQRDLQVGEADARLLKQAYPPATLVLLPNVNHVLKSVTSDDTGANIATYADTGLPVAPEVIESIVQFLAKELPSGGG